MKGGYRIYTTMDKDIQDYLDVVFADQDAENSIFPTVQGYNLKTFSYVEEQPNAAMVIMEPNGKLVGIAGGRGEKEGDRILNLATDGGEAAGVFHQAAVCLWSGYGFRHDLLVQNF